MTEPPTLIMANLCSGEEYFSMYFLISFSEPIAPNNFRIVSLIKSGDCEFISLFLCKYLMLGIAVLAQRIHWVDAH